ncbi:hypothetical protein M2D07_013810 [Pseudomonas sp. BGr12]|nr:MULTISPECIES: hypothetical protein [Pseudomonadaceae]MBD9504841.1 hypothetical protein [Pseudomonas sp. PDM17]MBD9516000.1 hypothetical protein [Pseudomonas sp. PDM22]MBD9579289.1 hypothetical protein [Pseudomonas sp. PDM23]MBD9672726.1 hypothetical protein [Pseudomonas sp. PDM21]MBD9683634.1 hypothetical protein [Pseudomonas sp. PDM20]
MYAHPQAQRPDPQEAPPDRESQIPEDFPEELPMQQPPEEPVPQPEQ